MEKQVPPRMIEIGSKCNNFCIFCCQVEQRYLPDKNIQKIKEEIDNAVKDGVDNLSLQGGELTIRKDGIELIKYAFSKNCFKNIHITTNGIMFYYKDYAKKIADAGLSAANFSIHSSKPEIHDRLTNSKGSFKYAVQGVKNLNRCTSALTNTPVNVCSSITLLKQNYKNLLELVQFFNKLNIWDFHINYVIPVGNAYKNFEKVVPKYSQIQKYVIQVIDYCKKNKIKIFFTNIPLCFMQDYELYLDEAYKSSFTMVPFYHPGKKIITKYREEIRMEMKVKLEKCKNCKYFNICEGVYKNYIEKYGDREIKPVKGKKLSCFFEHGSKRINKD
jgi:radical SAM protein with 4Fe4S-binding SPASM domain